MKILIHRGIAQIGGCITDITTGYAWILINLGQNLPDVEEIVNDELVNRKAIWKIT